MSIIIEVFSLSRVDFDAFFFYVWWLQLSFASLLVATFLILALRYPSFIINHTTHLKCVCMNVGLFLFYFLIHYMCTIASISSVYLCSVRASKCERRNIVHFSAPCYECIHIQFSHFFSVFIITIIFMSFLLVLVHGEWITGIVDYGYDDDNGMRMGREACQRVELNRKEAKSKN